MVLPLPAYPPQFGLSEVTGRVQWDLPVTPDGDAYVLDLEPWTGCSPTAPGRCCSPTRTTLRSGAHPRGARGRSATSRPHGARVISDEIHAPLVLPGADARALPRLDVTAEHAVAVVAGLQGVQHRGPQVRPGRHRPRADPGPADRRADGAQRVLVDARRGGSVAAYGDGDPWLAALVERLDQLRTLLADPARRAPARGADAAARGDLPRLARPARLRPPRPGGGRASRAACGRRPGTTTSPGLAGHVRLNIATSPERLTEIVRRMGAALG